MKKFLGMMITFEHLFLFHVIVSMVDMPLGKSCTPLKREKNVFAHFLRKSKINSVLFWHFPCILVLLLVKCTLFLNTHEVRT